MLLWVVGYAFFVFHGLSFHLTPWSQAFINAIVKHTYPAKGQEQTTVVLFREENLGALGIHYPVPYAVHADIIAALASYEPRAVFIDFAFIDPRPDDGVGELARALCALRGAGSTKPVDVLLAAPTGASVRSEFVTCARLVSPELDEAVGVSGVLTYASHAGQPPRPTPAFALASEALGVEPARAAPMEIIWGKNIAPLNTKWMKCDEPSVLDALRLVLRHGPLALRLACPYTRTITVAHLLNSSGDADIRDAVHGQTVLYGAGFRLTGDRAESPVYADMPGVFLHAMAYDNLVTFGKAYKRAARHGVMARITDGVLLMIAAILLAWFPRESPPAAATFAELQAKLRRGAVAAGVVGLIVAGLAWRRGTDDALLALFAAYVLYRWRGARDLGFVLLTGVTLVTALFYYYVVDLGPRNILAFLVFFEVVRHLESRLKEFAARYFALKAGATVKSRAPLRVVDKFFSLYSGGSR